MAEQDAVVDNRVAAVVIMAAGAGTRMRSSVPKVLHPIAGKSMIALAIDTADALAPERLVVVVGHQREQVTAHLAEVAPHVTIAVQAQLLGTGDAVRAGLAALPGISGAVVVTSGDVPLLAGETLQGLVATHRSEGNAITVLTSIVPDPTGYGRIVREGDHVARIVEQKDASPDELDLNEINSGIYVFEADVLGEGIEALEAKNAQGELYLTDVIAYARQAGRRVGAQLLADHLQTEGVNDRIQLAERGAELNRRILNRWMAAGVTVIDPATTWVHAGVDLAEDVTLLPGTSLEGATSVASGAIIGPETTLIDVEVGENARVLRTHAELVVIGPEATVGPFTYMRPGTELAARVHVGAFVETKKAIIGEGTKVPHLTYCGDARIGAGSNIGAGTIFANYDGVGKYTTTVGSHSFVGSDSVLVAPVEIADGAYVAAGSTITGDVGPGELAVARGQQRNIAGWVARKRAGTKSASAAAAALAAKAEAPGASE
ncbi:MAG TPA: bifunctional UDP-N-acetylglucosamine diphosphorylase/glucosamine-1-phosphate N-acetyltransferase GlmU [Propionicimonas sp.]|nr:bifunctional UDP-N-acetylglucosamine diphosphorylase/glucosamine-1-phosphate N-acetyltransferase GlmU [Propionicimonas sp.]HQA77352.1 bifunctional UDP-N-acetylglucosamine diphosphorylase/glucosamine-1-phosphate N-acetyltransferase GlmU [Propionicimonas sp.]HQD97072.1 bifunctional UDP-N-acetylglucosamine diphosphorylase/glucosamine-1-phosphate N-acetyltransferase GlmU [Propionicimonas sp.]